MRVVRFDREAVADCRFDPDKVAATVGEHGPRKPRLAGACVQRQRGGRFALGFRPRRSG